MSIVVETDRLTLREFIPEDALSMFELNNDALVVRYTGDKPFSSIQEAEKFILHYSAYKETGFGRWAVVRNSDGRFLGWSGLKLNEEGLNDIGFRIFRDCWGEGYATEAARASLNLGFEKYSLDEIIGRTARENLASIRVLEKIGMKKWKTGACEGFADAIYYRIDQASYQNGNE